MKKLDNSQLFKYNGWYKKTKTQINGHLPAHNKVF